jgi:hypothetical protein
MAKYHVCGDIIQLEHANHCVIVSAVPARGEISALGVIVRKASAVTAALASALRDRLLNEVRAQVLAHGDLVAASPPTATVRGRHLSECAR